MRFSSWSDDGHFFIQGTRVAEHGDPRRGPRYQGQFDELRMVGDTVHYSYVPSSLHPDTLAMICFNVFFPWIGHTVEFPESVSPAVVEAINHPTFQRHKGEIDVVNSGGEPQVVPEANPDPVHPRDTVISFGGGVDSSALHVLFPEATLVYEAGERSRWRRNGTATGGCHASASRSFWHTDRGRSDERPSPITAEGRNELAIASRPGAARGRR